MLKKLISTTLAISILFSLTPSYAKNMDAFAADVSGAELISESRRAALKADESEITLKGKGYVIFPVMLPEGKLLSDYGTVTFQLQTNMDEDDTAPLSILAAPRGDFPEDEALNAIHIAEGTAADIELEINRENAALLGTRALEFSFYPHWEDADDNTQYTLSDVILIPAEEPLDNAKATVTNIAFNLEDDSVRVDLSRALKEGETLTLEAYNERNMRIGKWTRNTPELGLFVFDEVKIKPTQKIVAFIYDKKAGNRFEALNETE